MLSGVGPSEHLKEFDIPVIQDLRVGFNLQDHNIVNGLDFIVDRPVSFNERSLINPSYMLDYFIRGSGPFTVRKCCHLNSQKYKHTTFGACCCCNNDNNMPYLSFIYSKQLVELKVSVTCFIL